MKREKITIRRTAKGGLVVHLPNGSFAVISAEYLARTIAPWPNAQIVEVAP